MNGNDVNLNSKFKPKSGTKKKTVYRNGIITLTQKELKHELEKIELARRQYRNSHSREQRKIITRLATKLIRSSSDLEHLNFENKANKSSSSSNNSLNNESSERDEPSSSFSRGKTFSALPSLGRKSGEFSLDGSIRRTNSGKPNASITPSLLRSSIRRSKSDFSFDNISENGNEDYSSREEATPKKTKKNVKFNEEVLEKESTKEIKEPKAAPSSHSAQSPSSSPQPSLNPSHRFNNITLHEINRKYDDFMMRYPDSRPNVIIPQLLSTKTKASSESREVKRTSSSTDAQHKLTRECTDNFLSLLNDESGFYTYKNSKGEDICSGYDNYLKQMQENITNPRQNVDIQKENEKKFVNPFNHATPPPTPLAIRNLRQFRGDANSLSMPNLKKGANQVRSISANTYKQELIRRRKEEEDKISNDAIRILSIKSLTFKPVVIY